MQKTKLIDKAISIELSVFKFLEPLETEYIANFFAEPYPNSLRAGFELRLFQILGRNFYTFPAEDRKQPGGKQTEKRIYFHTRAHVCNPHPTTGYSCENRNPKL